jgi:hypothetical protein
MKFQTYFHPKTLPYLGKELSPHFILSKFRVEGSCLSAFIGPCDVKTDFLVDWEDRLANDHIRAKKMIHFLGEFFGVTLKEGVWIQRLIVSQIHAYLLAEFAENPKIKIERDGDDLFVTNREEAIKTKKPLKQKKATPKKLSVSIVTASPVSVLLHLGINVDSTGAPVEATGLSELRIDPEKFAKKILSWFEKEFESVERACVKVRPVI